MCLEFCSLRRNAEHTELLYLPLQIETWLFVDRHSLSHCRLYSPQANSNGFQCRYGCWVIRVNAFSAHTLLWHHPSSADSALDPCIKRVHRIFPYLSSSRIYTTVYVHLYWSRLIVIQMAISKHSGQWNEIEQVDKSQRYWIHRHQTG